MRFKNKTWKTIAFSLSTKQSRKNRTNTIKPVSFGDTEIDYKAAKKANVDFIYAAYGYGQKNYKTKINTFKDILRFIKYNNNVF